ncbi:MAG TPA: ABC-F family ATP-binding cassette domain-containing protein [Spirochaetota bacterium]|nr:ABC-F family ATP-binding cassette domain-containing protein [Spirochaetota bacterium]
MSLIKFINLTKCYGANVVLENINYQINPGEKIGIVGLNGTGKTTLLKIITKEIGYDNGNVEYAKNLNIGYLSQHTNLNGDKTIYETISTALSQINSLKKEMEIIERKLSCKNENIESLTEKYGDLQHKFEESGGYKIDYLIDNVLNGLGFKKTDWDKKIDILSGGQKSRVALGMLLLEKPDLILLDEPTNHLDIDAVNWLEEYLSKYEKSLVIVSHDRFFLDKVVNKIIEIENYSLTSYTGNYTKYIEQKTQKIALSQKNYNLQKALIEEKQDFIRRNIAGQKTKQAKSRIKELAKMEILKPPPMTRKITLNFPIQKRGGNDVLTIENFSKSFGELSLFKDFCLKVERKERIGLIGANGTGKTTLLKTIIGEENYEGAIKIGSAIDTGYYAQDLKDCDDNNSIIDEVWQINPALTEGEMRSYLGRFLFYDDEVFMEIKYLSGGERARVSLAKIILSRANFLILDEPTNHLDIFSRTALEEALQNYEGAILTVSHDRYFLNKIVDKIIYLENGKSYIYNGNYDYFSSKRSEEKLNLGDNREKKDKTDYENFKREKKANRIKLRYVADIEKEISQTENAIIEYENEIGKKEVYSDYKKTSFLNEKINEANETLQKLYEEWEFTIEQKNVKR